MQITYYGHSCLGLYTQGVHVLIDPFITANPMAAAIKVDQIPADFILITHAHFDHVSDVEVIAARTGAKIISNYEIATYFEKLGLTGHPLNLGGRFDFPFGTIKMVSALHSSVFADGVYGGSPGGFVLWNDEGCVYIAGDTALTLDMQLIPMTCPPLDVAILPVGDNYTMGYEDACIAADFVRCDTIIGCHYDTMGHIKIDHEEAISYFERENKTLHLLSIGEALTF